MKFFLLAGALFALFFLFIGNHHVGTDSTIQINGHSLTVEWARTQVERERGLMNRKSLAADHGMFFEFPDAQKLSFWNKDTLIPLDILWIRDHAVIGIDSLPSVQERGIVFVSSPELADHVLEVSRGWVGQNQIKIGDLIAY